MVEHTDMDKVKAAALSMLNEEVVVDESFPKDLAAEIGNRVIHPFFTSAVEVVVRGEGDYVAYDLLGNPDDLQKAKENKARQIDKCKTPISISLFIRKGYRLEYFKNVKEFLSLDDMSALLHEAWKSGEHTNEEQDFTFDELVELFESCNPAALMGKDYEAFQHLPDVLKIYRGVSGYNKENIYAMSWTLDPEVALQFAERLAVLNDEAGDVYEAKIKKEDVLAYFSHEEEVVVVPDALYDVELSNEYVV